MNPQLNHPTRVVVSASVYALVYHVGKYVGVGEQGSRCLDVKSWNRRPPNFLGSERIRDIGNSAPRGGGGAFLSKHESHRLSQRGDRLLKPRYRHPSTLYP